MKIYTTAVIHFDGTTLAIEIDHLSDCDAGVVFNGHTDAGARVIEFLRAKGLDVYDKRADPTKRPATIQELEDILNSEGDEAVLVSPDGGVYPPAGDRPRPLYPEPVESHHVTHAEPSPPKPKEEISL